MTRMATLPTFRDGDQYAVPAGRRFAFEAVIDEICRMRWESADRAGIMRVAKAYYYFSVQFRENLEIACDLYPEDECLGRLRAGECDTDNLSPWPGVTAPGEKLDHDEFMKRLLAGDPVDRDPYLTSVGSRYLDRVRNLDVMTRGASIASYEDGGLSQVFGAMLRANDWRGAGPAAFKFFLEQHVLFDSDEEVGHGALARHLKADDAILPLWTAFRDLLAAALPRLVEVPRPGRVVSPLIAIPRDWSGAAES